MQSEQRYRAGSALDEESNDDHGPHGSKMPSIQKAEKVAPQIKSNKAIPSKVAQKITKGKKPGSKVMSVSTAASPYNKSIAQMYKNLEALRKNTGNSTSNSNNNNKEEDPFLPYLAPMSAPKVPPKVNLDLKTSMSHYMHTNSSLAEPSIEAANGFVVASGMVGEEPR